MTTPDKAEIILDAVAAWEPVIGHLALLGVKSWQVIHAMLKDSGADTATIAALQPKWDALADKIKALSQP